MRERRTEPPPFDAARHFHVLAATMPDAVIVSDSGLLVSFANAAAARLFGYEPDELPDLPLPDLLPDHARLQVPADVAADDEVPGAPHEAEGIRKDGRRIRLEIVAAATVAGEDTFVTYVLRPRASAEPTAAARAPHDDLVFTQAVLENISDGVVACDADGTLTIFNKAAREMHGLDAARLPAREWANAYNLMHDDGTPLEPHEVALYRAWQGERVRNAPMTIRSASGVVRRVLSNGQPLSDAAGRSLGAVIAMRDVTEEERAREAAERAHRQLVEAIESLSEGFALFDENDRLVICNAKYREIYRDTGEPLQPGSTFEDIIRAGIERGQYAEAAGREEDFVRERVASHRNPPGTPIEQPLGDGRWVRIQERRTHGGGIVGIRTDITELKEREAALRESEERWRTLVETHPNPVLLQSDFRVLYANNAALDVYGAEHAEDLIGRNLLDFLEPEYREHVQERMTSISRGEHLPPRDYRIVRLDGAKRYVEAYSVPTAFRGQTVIQTIFWDVTERRRMEAQLQTARLKMVEARETERVHIARELHDGVMQQLLGVSYASAELERRIGRVPQLAGDASLPADMRAYRQELLQAVAQLRSVLKGLRPAGLEELGFGAALQDFVGALERSGGAGAPTFELDVRFEGPLPDLVGLTLFRVAQEATRNALKHAAATTVTIRAWQDDGGVHLVVADDGRGFTVPEQVTHLARDDHFGLVGLQEYVQAVRGTLAIRSAPRAGTSIVVTIPARAT